MFTFILCEAYLDDIIDILVNNEGLEDEYMTQLFITEDIENERIVFVVDFETMQITTSIVNTSTFIEEITDSTISTNKSYFKSVIAMLVKTHPQHHDMCCYLLRSFYVWASFTIGQYTTFSLEGNIDEYTLPFASIYTMPIDSIASDIHKTPNVNGPQIILNFTQDQTTLYLYQ